MSNQLLKRQEFEKVLSDYQPSSVSLEDLEHINLTLLISSSGVGRDTLMKELVKSGNYEIALTDTTRQPRVNDGQLEQDGVEYYFRSEQQMLDDLRQGKLIDAAIIHNQQVSGMRAAELERAGQQAAQVIADVETSGAEHYHRLKPSAKLIFVVPPDLETWLGRMTNRGALEQDEIRRRLQSAEAELQHALDHDYYLFLVNDKLEDAVADLDQMITGEPLNNQSQLRDKVWQLLNQLKRKLYS